MANQFEDIDLKLINKCYICFQLWTQQKTSPGKIAHFKKCARKNEIDEEIVVQKLVESLQKQNSIKNWLRKGDSREQPPAQKKKVPVKPEYISSDSDGNDDGDGTSMADEPGQSVTALAPTSEGHNYVPPSASTLVESEELEDGEQTALEGKEVELLAEAGKDVVRSTVGEPESIPGLASTIDLSSLPNGVKASASSPTNAVASTSNAPVVDTNTKDQKSRQPETRNPRQRRRLLDVTTLAWDVGNLRGQPDFSWIRSSVV